MRGLVATEREDRFLNTILLTFENFVVNRFLVEHRKIPLFSLIECRSWNRVGRG